MSKSAEELRSEADSRNERILELQKKIRMIEGGHSREDDVPLQMELFQLQEEANAAGAVQAQAAPAPIYAAAAAPSQAKVAAVAPVQPKPAPKPAAADEVDAGIAAAIAASEAEAKIAAAKVSQKLEALMHKSGKGLSGAYASEQEKWLAKEMEKAGHKLEDGALEFQALIPAPKAKTKLETIRESVLAKFTIFAQPQGAAAAAAGSIKASGHGLEDMQVELINDIIAAKLKNDMKSVTDGLKTWTEYQPVFLCKINDVTVLRLINLATENFDKQAGIKPASSPLVGAQPKDAAVAASPAIVKMVDPLVSSHYTPKAPLLEGKPNPVRKKAFGSGAPRVDKSLLEEDGTYAPSPVVQDKPAAASSAQAQPKVSDLAIKGPADAVSAAHDDLEVSQLAIQAADDAASAAHAHEASYLPVAVDALGDPLYAHTFD